MLCRAFGVANHSPEEVVTSLLKHRVTSKACEIGILPTLARADTRFKYLLLNSTLDFTRNLTRLSQSSLSVFVFSNPIDLSSFSGMTYLDFQPKDTFSFEYGPLDIQAIIKSTPTQIFRTVNTFLPNLIDSVRRGSLLNPFMTFVYSLSAHNQNAVKVAAVKFLYYGHSIDKLADDVSIALTERATDKLISILDTSIAKSYVGAFAVIRSMRKAKAIIDIESIANETSTSSYELSYMLSILDDIKETYSDSLDKAKNRKRASHLRT